VAGQELQLRVGQLLELGDGASQVALLVDLLTVAEAHHVVEGDAGMVRRQHYEAAGRHMRQLVRRRRPKGGGAVHMDVDRVRAVLRVQRQVTVSVHLRCG